MNQTTRDQLADLVWARRTVWASLFRTYGAANPFPVVVVAYEEIERFVDGLVAVMVACLRGDGESLRAEFIDANLSLLIDYGGPERGLMYGSVTVCFAMARDFGEHLPEAQRAEATGWLASFFAALLADSSRVLRGQPVLRPSLASRQSIPGPRRLSLPLLSPRPL
jgi:hypothetical protein